MYSKYIFLNPNNTVSVPGDQTHSNEFFTPGSDDFKKFNEFTKHLIVSKLQLIKTLDSLLWEKGIELRVVLLNTGNNFNTIKELYDILNIPVVDSCNSLKVSKYDLRLTGLGVYQYCKKHNISKEDYVIIDSDNDYLYEQSENLHIVSKNYKTNEYKGLTKEIALTIANFFLGTINAHLQLNEYSIEEVTEYIKNNNSLFNGYKVPKKSDKYALFMEKDGLICVKCGMKANTVFLHRNFDPDNFSISYHFEFYYKQLDNNLLHLFTKDHILPKSKGGKDHISNYQTMCRECNLEKGNKIEK